MSEGQTRSAESDSLRTVGSIVGNAEDTGPPPRRCRLESHRNGAASPRAHGAPAVVGLGEIPAGFDGVDHERDCARVGQRDGLGLAAGSYYFGREGK